MSPLFEGSWVRCATCKSVHRPIPGLALCLDCTSSDVAPLDPGSDQVFLARRGFYRRPVMAALETHAKPMALIAAEHTAQLNSPQSEDVFSKAEENELLFQDIVPFLGEAARKVTAIDVLSSTTTMEVALISVLCPASLYEICRPAAQIINSVLAELVGVPTPLQRSWLSAALIAMTSIISVSPMR